MLPDWFNTTVNQKVAGAGATTLDEWTFCEVLGQDGCKTALTEHFNNFVTEEDIQTLYEHVRPHLRPPLHAQRLTFSPEQGINHLRIPTGFWAWIPTTDDEPYVNDQALYQGQIERILGFVLSFLRPSPAILRSSLAELTSAPPATPTPAACTPSSICTVFPVARTASSRPVTSPPLRTSIPSLLTTTRTDSSSPAAPSSAAALRH